MRRDYVLFVIMLLSICFLSFAGPNDNVVTIQYAFWGNPDTLGVEGDIISAFEAKYPNIKVEPVVTGYGDYHTKLLTMVAGGLAPDVMRISSQYLPDFVSSKGLRDIGKMAKDHNYDLSIYYKDGLTDCSWNGVLYGLPWGTAPIYMLMNLTMFEDAGIPLPSYDWNLADFTKIVKGLTSGSGVNKKYGFAMEIQSDLYPILPFVWANGGLFLDETRKIFMLDKPEAYEAIQILADLYQQGYMPKETLMTGTQTITVPSWFANNKVAMFQGTAANILMLQNAGVKFAVWPLPSRGNNSHTTVVKSNAISISTNSKHPEEAWKFVSFLRGEEGEMLYMKAKRVPPSLMGDKYWDAYINPNLYPKNIKEVTNLVFSKYGRLAPLRKGYLELEQYITPIIQNIMLGNITAEKALKDASSKAQKILDKNY